MIFKQETNMIIQNFKKDYVAISDGVVAEDLTAGRPIRWLLQILDGK